MLHTTAHIESRWHRTNNNKITKHHFSILQVNTKRERQRKPQNLLDQFFFFSLVYLFFSFAIGLDCKLFDFALIYHCVLFYSVNNLNEVLFSLSNRFHLEIYRVKWPAQRKRCIFQVNRQKVRLLHIEQWSVNSLRAIPMVAR